MAEIKLRAEDARQMAEHVRSESTAAQSQMDSLQSYLGNISDSFTGQAANAFSDAFTEWKQGSNQMLQGLTALGDFLTNAARVIEETDSSIAAQLRA